VQPAPQRPTDAPPTGRPATDAGDTSGDFEEELAALDQDGPAVKSIPACNELRGANGCTGVGATMLLCMALGNVLLDQPTARFVECLTQKQGTEALCHARVVEPCAYEAIAETEVLPEADGACGVIFAKCSIPKELVDAFTVERCRKGLSSARAVSRRDFVGGMKERCELRLCVGQLL
jgi:hypothetical protein